MFHLAQVSQSSCLSEVSVNPEQSFLKPSSDCVSRTMPHHVYSPEQQYLLGSLPLLAL